MPEFFEEERYIGGEKSEMSSADVDEQTIEDRENTRFQLAKLFAKTTFARKLIVELDANFQDLAGVLSNPRIYQHEFDFSEEDIKVIDDWLEHMRSKE